jgi:hypothetical protein
MLGGALKTYNLQNSPEVQQMRDTDNLMQQIDVTSPEEVKVGYDELMKIGNVKGALELLRAHNEFASTPVEYKTSKDVNGYLRYEEGPNKGKRVYETEKEAKPDGTRYQLVETLEDGSTRQLGTKFVGKGDDLPKIPSAESTRLSWQTIGSGAKGPSATATANAGGEGSEFYKYLGKNEAEQFAKDTDAARGLVKSLRSQKDSIGLLDEGIISGFGANVILGVGKMLESAGMYSGDTLARTEAYYANQAKQVAEIIKAFGSGTGLSDADRKYAEKASAGEITMTEDSLRRIIDINNKASRNALIDYNKRAKQVEDKAPAGVLPYSLVLDIPEFGPAMKINPNTMSDEELLKSLGM